MTRYLLLTGAMALTFFSKAQNVGIGTSTPTAKLDIIGTVKITDGSQGANKILTSGSDGTATWTKPPAPTCFFFATDQSVGNNDYIGLGTNSSVFLRNTTVVPFNCELSSIILSARGLNGNQGITATVWRQSPGSTPQATTLSTIIVDGLTTYFAATSGSVVLSQGDLISIRLSWPVGGALASGVAMSVVYK